MDTGRTDDGWLSPHSAPPQLHHAHSTRIGDGESLYDFALELRSLGWVARGSSIHTQSFRRPLPFARAVRSSSNRPTVAAAACALRVASLRRSQAPVQQYVPAPVQYAVPNGGSWQRDLYQQQAAAVAAPVQQEQAAPVKKISGDTIHVSNLASDVSDEDVLEIFQRIGAVRSCSVNYSREGRSLGTATVVFAQKAHAEQAVAEYDEAEVDGRPMKLKLIGNVVTAPVVVKKQKPQVVVQPQAPIIQQPLYIPQTLPQLQFAPSYAQQPRQPKQQHQQQPKQHQQQQSARGGAAGRGGRSGKAAESAPQRGGRGGARGGRAGARQQPKEVSGADLDAELDSYHAAQQKKPDAAEASEPAAAGQPVTV